MNTEKRNRRFNVPLPVRELRLPHTRFCGEVRRVITRDFLRRLAIFFLLLFFVPTVRGQIDPTERRLLQLGYNKSIEGRGPTAGYAFFYYNQPGFVQTNLTLRVAIAPVYLDSELGIAHALGPHTDIGLGIAGGGFAEGFSEVRGGSYLASESFTGHGGGVSASIYHLFNPGQRIPLTAVLRGGVNYTVYARDSDTAANFVLPDDRTSFRVRAGLRFGGIEPVLTPDLAMELSTWYEGQFRNNSGAYGFAGDREEKGDSHLFWSRALLAYTLPSEQKFFVSITAGTSAQADRFSAYRLGAVLPLASEFPLSIPGYYFQEITASRFALFSGYYLVPLGPKKEWNVTVFAATAAVDYLAGMEQPGDWHSGVGAALGYRPRNKIWQVSVGYAYGIDAIRKNDRGAQSIGFLLQYDLESQRRQRATTDPNNSIGPNRWQFLRSIFGF